MKFSRLDELWNVVILWVLLQRLNLPEAMVDQLLRCEEQSGAFTALELLNARFLHSLTQMLDHILRRLISFDKIRPSVLIAANLTVIDRVFVVERIS